MRTWSAEGHKRQQAGMMVELAGGTLAMHTRSRPGDPGKALRRAGCDHVPTELGTLALSPARLHHLRPSLHAHTPGKAPAATHR